MPLDYIQRQEFDRYLSVFDFSSFFDKKTILVTGAGGMTGSAIVNWIIMERKKGGTDVSVYASTRRPDQTAKRFDLDSSLHFCEFGKESEELKNLKIDVIIHCASPTGREFFINNPVETFKVIAEETDKLLEFAVQNKGCTFILLSSVSVYGIVNDSKPIKESFVGAIDPMGFRNGYPLGKKAAEYLCAAYHREFGLDTRIIRSSDIQGLTQPYNEGRVVNEIVRCLVENKDLVLHSKGNTKKCFVYTLDIITAIMIVLTKGIAGEIYNVADISTFMSITELANKIFKKFNPNLKVIMDLKNPKKKEYLPESSFVQDVSKIKALGWNPYTPYEKVYEIDYNRFMHK